jgi:predicted Zn-dependent peptidase
MASKNPWTKYRYKKSTLPSGVRVVTENHPSAVAVSIGVFVNKGTRDEAKDEAGLAHFVEHMVFKGTKNRNAFEISRDMEEVGADINAFTSREATSFVAFGLPEYLPRYVDVLCDVVTRPTFTGNDVAMEKDVVIQEIRSSEDQLDDCVYDRHFENAFKGSTLALPILGSMESISTMSRERVLKFYRRQYVNQNMVIAAAGRVDHDSLCALVNKHMGELRGTTKQELPAGTALGSVDAQSFTKVIRRRAEQAHILVGTKSPGFRDHQRFESIMLNGMLGGGLTSRLYQEVRENRGLAYSVYSHLYSFVDAGTMMMYAATEPTKAPEALSVVFEELTKLRTGGFDKEELEMVRAQIRSATILGSDDPESRMQSIAINEQVFGRYRSLDEVLTEYSRVKSENVREMANEVLRTDSLGVTIMGPMPEKPMVDWVEKQRTKWSKTGRSGKGSQMSAAAKARSKKSRAKRSKTTGSRVKLLRSANVKLKLK